MERQKVSYFAIHVFGYDGLSLAYQIHKNEVYVSRTGRYCGLGKEKRFHSREAARKHIDERKDKDKYEFEVVQMTVWE